MMVDLSHSNGQLRTERDGDTEKGCQKPAVQQNTTDDEARTLKGPSRHPKDLFTGWMPLLVPNKQCQSTELRVNEVVSTYKKIIKEDDKR